MSKWTYTLTKGKWLREAIEDGDEQLVVKCLLACYKELYDKLTDEDKEWKGFDIEDVIGCLEYYDEDEGDNIDYYLAEFYDLCDELRAWVTL